MLLTADFPYSTQLALFWPPFPAAPTQNISISADYPIPSTEQPLFSTKQSQH